MEEDKKLINNNNCSADFKQNDEVGSLDAIGVFLNRFRQMDAKKLQQLASNPALVAQTNGPSIEGAAKDTNNESRASDREKMLEVIYGNKLMVKEKPQRGMCFVVDAHERKIRIMSKEEQKKQESFAFILEDLTDDQFARFGKAVKDREADNSDAFVHCEKCSQFYEFCCLEHPLYQCKDRGVPSSSPTEIEDRAAATLPAFLFVQNSLIPSAGKGVFTKVDIPVGIVFGPYEGILTQNLSDLELGAYAWELRIGNGKPAYYLDAKDPRYSNWMRYINSPRNEAEQNLIAFQYQGSVYYRVFKPIDRSAELLVWYGKSYGKELGIIDTSVKRVPRAFFYYSGKSPFIL